MKIYKNKLIYVVCLMFYIMSSVYSVGFAEDDFNSIQLDDTEVISEVRSISVSDKEITLEENQSMQIGAYAVYDDNSYSDITKLASWRAETSLVTVNEGLIKSNGSAGSTRIILEYGNLKEYIKVTIGSLNGANINTQVAIGTTLKLRIGNRIMTINGQDLEIDPGLNTIPVIVNGRALLPVRKIIESLGGQVNWDGSESKVTLSYNNNLINLWIDSYEAEFNQVKKNLDVAPMIINGRTMMPIRFIAENLGFDVQWNAESQEIIIHKAN